MSEETRVPTDLVVVIDTSGSMQGHAAKLSAAADQAISAAKARCNADVEVKWFGIEGTWLHKDPDTKFRQSYRQYLNANGIDGTRKGVADDKLAKLRGDDPEHGDFDQGDKEDGAAAVIDLVKYFDWRPEALRTIFFLGDEGLAQGDPNDTTDDVMRDRAIAQANARGVVVHTYCARPNTDVAADFKKLAEDTQGEFFGGDANDLARDLEAVFETVVCKSITVNHQKEPIMADNNRIEHQWNLNNDTGLLVKHEYPYLVDIERGLYTATVTCKNTGKLGTFKDITVFVGFDDTIKLWEVKGDGSLKLNEFDDLGPGEEDSETYSVRVKPDEELDVSDEEAAEQKPWWYFINLRPTFNFGFDKKERKTYAVGFGGDPLEPIVEAQEAVYPPF